MSISSERRGGPERGGPIDIRPSERCERENASMGKEHREGDPNPRPASLKGEDEAIASKGEEHREGDPNPGPESLKGEDEAIAST